MTDPASDVDLLRHSTLQDRLVLDYDTTESVGAVEALLVDVKQGRVEGLVCKAGLMGRQKERLSWGQLASIGTDSVVVRSHPSSGSERLMAAQPAVSLEVWTEAGNIAGQIVDFQFARNSGEVVWYLFAPEGSTALGDGLYGLRPSDILSAGRKRVMATAAAIEQADRIADGLPPVTAPSPEFLQDGSPTPQDWQSLVKGAKQLGQTVQQRAQELKDYTQGHLPELTEQLQGQTQQASNTVQKRFEKIRSQFQQQDTDRSPDPIDLDSFEVWEDD